MTCEEFWIMTEGADAQNHLTACASCAAALAAERHVARGLRAMSAGTGSFETPARVEANLLAAFRSVHGSGASASAPWWMNPVWAWAAAGLAAATLAFGLWVVPQRRIDPPAAHHAAPAQIQLAAYTPQESDDGFIPLPDAPQIDPNDDVNVVRMELPRTAMLEVGLDVPPDQVSGTVVAEVKLGSDGLARAVRFVE
jgi:hypothetical protein